MSGLGFWATPGWRQTTMTSVLECIRGFLHKSFILKDMGSTLCATWYRFTILAYSWSGQLIHGCDVSKTQGNVVFVFGHSPNVPSALIKAKSDMHIFTAFP